MATLVMASQRVPVALDAVGQAEGSREVEIRPRVSGILEKRLYTEGTPVKAGQTLFVIDRAQYEIAAAQAQAALSQEKTKQEQAQREAERLKPLAGGRAISQREYEEAVSTARQAAAAIEGAEARLAEAKLNLSYTGVNAPIGGIASRALRSEGSLVNANTDLLTTLTQVNPIWVRFSLAEADFERVRGAKNVRINILNRDGSVAADGGKLNFLGSTIDSRLGTVQLRAEFANAGMKWLPGQFLKIQILAGEQEAFLVPQSAVTQNEQGHTVWIAEGGKAGPRAIKTANWVGSDWIVTEGLKAGDTVITDNIMKLRPGITVEPRKTDAAAASPAAAAAEKPAAGR
ncbi:MAG: efflux RND transporter periplasmic adaptor subunit [Burkholderiales bacterium]|nr:efflux RND transporter periplasmic adaptor subunit [Burkholderiales bacterium]